VLGGQIVNIYVGSKQEKFCVHRRLLCEKSPYFERALNGSREIFAGVFRYQMEADNDAFAQLIEWLYKGTVTAPPARLPGAVVRVYIRGLINLYILAEGLEIKDLADDIVESLGSCYSLMGYLPSKDEIEMVFGVKKGASTLRRYMTAAYHFTLVACCHSANDGVYAPTTEELWKLARDHEDLGKALFKGLRKDAPEPEDPRSALICSYHNHDNQSPCAAREKRFNGEIVKGLDIAHAIPESLLPPAPKVNFPDGPNTYKALSNLPKQPDSRGVSHNGQKESSGSSQTMINETDWQNRINSLTGRKSPSQTSHGSESSRTWPDRDARGTSSANVLKPYPVSNKRGRPNSDRLEEDISAGKRTRGGVRPTR
jgi:hypothetical protein